MWQRVYSNGVAGSRARAPLKCVTGFSSPSDEVAAVLVDSFRAWRGYVLTAVPVASGGVQAEDADIVERLDSPAHEAVLLTANCRLTPMELLADVATKIRISDHRPAVPLDSPPYVRFVEAAPRPEP